MCHNLGADESADPFTPTYATNGAYYQWGGKDPTASAPNSSGADATNITEFSPYGYYGNGANDENATFKSDYDPCPPGYRVPSYNEWYSVVRNNTQTYVGSWTTSRNSTDTWGGSKFGEGLMLPTAGNRKDGSEQLYDRGFRGYYWSTRKLAGSWFAAPLIFGNDGAGISDDQHYITVGSSVRCIVE
jgi:uncharacterized protein (TIGR02145 family)